MNITLVRHGEVDNRYLGAYNGHNNIALSAKGHQQARELTEKFANENFDAYICSDLLRAKQSIRPLLKSKKAKAIYTKKLREKSWGRHEGLRYEQIVALEGCEYEDFNQWLALLDGEDYFVFIERVERYFLKELALCDYENVFIMTHSGVIKTMIHLIDEIPLQEAFSLNIPYMSFKKLSI